MKKKLFFILLLMFFTVSIFSDGVEPAGEGTENNPYQIATLDNLLWISTNSDSWDKYFIQTADIDASATHNWNNDEGFSPIGEGYDNYFSGSYDGQNHIIDNLFINRPNDDNQGLFGYIDTATIKNLGITNITLTAHGNIGALVGFAFHYSTIDSCFSTGNISGVSKTAGLAGKLDEQCIISNSHTNCNLIGEMGIGGIAGFLMFSTCNNCYNIANITGDELLGGLIAYSVGSNISNCYTDCTITGDENIAGLISRATDDTISNCFSNSELNGSNYIGGLIAQSNASNLINSYNSGLINGTGYLIGGLIGLNNWSYVDYCYNNGRVEGDHEIGGLIGTTPHEPDIHNSFWDIETSGQTESDGGTGKTTEEMKNIETYTNIEEEGLDIAWDFVGNPFDDIENGDVWDINSETNNGYPYLANLIPVSIDDNVIEPIQSVMRLHQNYPNPFNPTTTISYELPKNTQNAKIEIYNLKGQLLEVLPIDNTKKSVNWKADKYSSGVYLYRLNVSGKTKAVKKCILMK